MLTLLPPALALSLFGVLATGRAGAALVSLIASGLWHRRAMQRRPTGPAQALINRQTTPERSLP